MKNLKFIDLFAGIGGIRIPFENLGGKCVFSSEIDPYCQKVYEENFGEKPFGDITKIDPKDIPDHDILLAGFPCQSFSIIGEGRGFTDTRGTLFFNIERILQIKRPQAFLLENVKQLFTHDGGKTYAVIEQKLKDLGYTIQTKILNSLDFGLPQKRERTYIVGFLDSAAAQIFNFPVGNKKYSLDAILEPEDQIPNKYFASEYIQEKRLRALKSKPPVPSIWHENISGNISTLPYSCALRASGSYNYLLVNGKRRFTERELLRLQGFPDTYKIVVNYSKTRHQAGNSVSVPVIAAIADEMNKVFSAKKPSKRSISMSIRTQAQQKTSQQAA